MKIYFIIIAFFILNCQKPTISDQEPLELDFNITNVSQYGLSDGAIDLIVSGGTEPYSYLWSNNETTQDISNLIAGKYIITVNDSDNQSITDSVEIDQPAKIKYLNVLIPTSGLTLSGILTIPNNSNLSPVAILVSGADQDKDGLIPSSPDLIPPIYKTWGDTLAWNGINVLRYDQRILTLRSPVSFALEKRIDDIKAVIEYIKTRDDVDTNRIFIIGHSEGAIVGPIASEDDPSIRGNILISPTVIAVDSMIISSFEEEERDPNLIEDVKSSFQDLRSGNYPYNWTLFNKSAKYWEPLIAFTENADSIMINLNKPILNIIGLDDHTIQGKLFPNFIEKLNKISENSNLITNANYPFVDHYLQSTISGEVKTETLYDIIDWINQY